MDLLERDRRLIEWLVRAGGRFSESVWLARHGDSGMSVVEDVTSGEELARLRDWQLAELIASLPEIVYAAEGLLEYVDELEGRAERVSGQDG